MQWHHKPFLFQAKNTVKSLEYTEPSVLIIKKVHIPYVWILISLWANTCKLSTVRCSYEQVPVSLLVVFIHWHTHVASSSCFIKTNAVEPKQNTRRKVGLNDKGCAWHKTPRFHDTLQWRWLLLLYYLFLLTSSVLCWLSLQPTWSKD